MMKNIWTCLMRDFIAGLLFWLIFFLVMNFYMFSDYPSTVPKYLVETIVQRPHVPLKFGFAGLVLGAIFWAIRNWLARRSAP